MPEEKSTLTFGSLFAGIGGFDSGFEAAGMRCLWQVEIDDACNRVLERHWPGVRRHRDVKGVGNDNVEAVDLICGGFPCQDLSVAGCRAGLAGEHSGLFFEFMRIIDEISPAWVVIENVPGLLSSARGWDMAAVLGTLAKLGYGYAYRVLDAQYFGVAQRRRRVFIVGHLGESWSAPAEVLFEPESCERDSPPSREKKSLSATLLASGAGTSRTAGIKSETDFLVTQSFTCSFANGADVSHAQGGFLVPDYVASNMGGVRRLTPLECERLQGFPDGWTAGESDTARYKMVGNAVCRKISEWLGKRIIKSEMGGFCSVYENRNDAGEVGQTGRKKRV
jgi:DNA (cytosine-5)-methyltransferase 1